MTDDEQLTHYDNTKHVRYRKEFVKHWVCRDCEDIDRPEPGLDGAFAPIG